MNAPMKRILPTAAIVLASVAFGVLISADLGLMSQSHAQSPAIQTQQGPVTSVTIPSFADVAQRVMPAVVSITTTEVVKASDMRKRGMGIDPFEFFFPDPRDPHRQRGGDDQDDEHKQLSGGSGFIISPDGYILTNNHVVDNASKVEVHYGADENGVGGHTVTARIVGRDPATDIALLKIQSSQPLPTVPLGDSDRIRKGDWAIAIGNPFQFENTLTVGVISAKGRSLGGLTPATRSFENFIQTDAAINFGNSGGPLLNINGEVVGIDTAIRGGGAQGLGFATPINTAKRLLPQLKQGKVTRGYLGMQIGEVGEAQKEAFNLPEARGAIVESVDADKPAAKAGVQHGDVILQVDDHKVRGNRDLIDYISYLPVGSKVRLTIFRNGETKVLTAETAQRPSEGEQASEPDNSAISPARNKLGMSVSDITPQLRQRYAIDENLKGVVVTSVKEVSPAGDILAEGDVVSEIQGEKITNVEQFRTAIDKAKSGQYLRFYVTSPTRGGGAAGYRVLQVP